MCNYKRVQFNIIKRYSYYSCLGLILLALLCPFKTKAQYFDITGGKKRVSMPFKLVRNLVIIQLHINNKGPFNFVMDTGVSSMVITDPKLIDSINITLTRNVKLYGLGGDRYEAFVVPRLQVDMPNISSYLMQAVLLKSDPFNLSSYAGMPIHGLLGYDFFNRLAVRFNFADSTMQVSRPENMRLLKKGIRIPITIEDKKPYLLANIKMPDGKIVPHKLVIDLGAGHPLSLEHIVGQNTMPTNFVAANLGMGLTGPIDGYISRVDEIQLGKYSLKNVITSFPDMSNLNKQVDITPRDGNLGIGLLKRFTLVIDYTGKCIYLKPGPFFKQPFEHDMSGMEYYLGGDNFSHLIVSRVEPDSPAYNIGLMPEDEITNINLKAVSKMNMEEIDQAFRSKDGRNLLLRVYRNNKPMGNVILTLKRRI